MEYESQVEVNAVVHAISASIDPVVPIFPTPRALKPIMDSWSNMLGELQLKNEIWRISRSLKLLARPLLEVPSVEQLDGLVTETAPKYAALKFGIAKLIMLQAAREGGWSPERFLKEYAKACAEAIRIVRKRARSKLDEDRSEMLVSAVEGLVLFSKRLLSSGIQGEVRDEETVRLCLEPFIKADFLLLACFLALNGEIKRFEKAALELVAERADFYITQVEDIILSRNFDFPDREETIPLAAYMARKAT